MKLAILDTVPKVNWPSDEGITDGQKFTELLAPAMPGYEFEAFYLAEGPLPEFSLDNDWGGFDGFLITGSPLSVHDDLPWIPGLEQLIRRLHESKHKLAGFCFGHQLIVKALGGEVKDNEHGWHVGLFDLESTRIPEWMDKEHATTSMFHFNRERVHALPKEAESFARCGNYDHFGYTIGSHIMAVQGHPEQPRRAMLNFIKKVVKDGNDPSFNDPKFVEKVHKSIDSGTPDTDLWSAWVSRFYRTN